MKSSFRFGLLLGLVLCGGILVNAWTYLGEARVARKELKEFPTQIGPWQRTGSDGRLDSDTMKVLGATDYLLRDYRRPDGQLGNFYVGYYASQRDGATYHSPLNCLPGSGWTLSDRDVVSIPLSNGKSLSANKYVIQNGYNRTLMIYWYQGRGRAVASEYWGKIYTVIDGVRLRRSDGALVRVTVPILRSEAAALQSAVDLATNATSTLSEFVPD
jgi:EpsI family protein